MVSVVDAKQSGRRCPFAFNFKRLHETVVTSLLFNKCVRYRGRHLV